MLFVFALWEKFISERTKETPNLPGSTFPSTCVNLRLEPNNLLTQLIQQPHLRLQPLLLLLQDLDAHLQGHFGTQLDFVDSRVRRYPAWRWSSSLTTFMPTLSFLSCSASAWRRDPWTAVRSESCPWSSEMVWLCSEAICRAWESSSLRRDH